MLPENEHWGHKKLCVCGDSEGVDLPHLVQSILNRTGISKLELSYFAQNVPYLVFRTHERSMPAF